MYLRAWYVESNEAIWNHASVSGPKIRSSVPSISNENLQSTVLARVNRPRGGLAGKCEKVVGGGLHEGAA